MATVQPNVAANSSLQVRDVISHKVHTAVIPTTDIDGCLRFSWLRLVLSIVGFLLVLTDVPRTGLSIPLTHFYPKASVGTVMYWGAYIYPVAHINATTTAPHYIVYAGREGDTPITVGQVWAYKFDTLSIAPRAIAAYLNVSSYPSCILYREECPEPTLSLQSAFRLFDGLIEAIRQRYFRVSAWDHRPVVFRGRNNWIDRMHEYIHRRVWKKQDVRLHSVHHFRSHHEFNDSDFTICAPHGRLGDRPAAVPILCDKHIPWQCDHPEYGPSVQVSLAEHVRLRAVSLTKEYPGLEIDLTIFSSRLYSASEPHALIPAMYILSDTLEITTLIRGRRCTSEECETIFIDDFRYERSFIESNEDHWWQIAAVLRVIAQGYVWIRVILLWLGCYIARANEPNLRNRRLWIRLAATWITFFKVPCHSIIYGNWVPIVAYSLAHLIDGSVIHLASEVYFSSLKGLFEFNFFRYVLLASIQMRSVWQIALMWKIAMILHARFLRHRGYIWHPCDGMVGIRSMLITSTSSLTIFSCLRALSFRDTNVIELAELPRHVPFTNRHGRPPYNNIAEYGYRLDLKLIVISLMIVCASLGVVQALFRSLLNRTANLFFARSYYIPLSADAIWSRTNLNIFWYVRWRRSRQSSLYKKWCPDCKTGATLILWQAQQGCLLHQAIFDPHTRTIEMWSTVRLLNIAMMSDPVVLVRLYVTGIPLYLYRVKQNRVTSSTISLPAFLLPCRIHASASSQYSQADTKSVLLHSAESYELIAIVDSRTVPWSTLVNVG